MRLRKILISAIVLVLIVLFASLFVDKATPRVVTYSPENLSEDLPYMAQITIEFSVPMNRASVEKALQISPKVDGDFFWDENTVTFSPTENWKIGEIVEVIFQEGAISSFGFSLIPSQEFQFEIRHILLAYLHEDNGLIDIFALGVDGDFPQKLTSIGTVLDYSVDSIGENIYFSAGNQNSGSDLYVYNRFSQNTITVLKCNHALCENAAISPSGHHLAFTRTNNEGIAELWIHGVQGRENSQISQNGHEIRFPQWNSKGNISFYDATVSQYFVVSIDGKIDYEIESLSGEKGSWSPNGKVFVAPYLFTRESDILLGPFGEAAFDNVPLEDLTNVSLLNSHLFAYTENRNAVNLSNEMWAEDLNPAFSPNGRWLAFARRFNDEFRWIPGRQLMVMPAEGGQVTPLTNDEEYKYTSFAWHPSGDMIAAVRFNALSFTSPSEIWIVDLLGQSTRLIIGGFNPQWIP